MELAILEKVVGVSQTQSFKLELVSERVSAKEIVVSHVKTQVALKNLGRSKKLYNHNQAASFLVGNHTHPDEVILNKSRPRKSRLMLEDIEIEKTLRAFDSNAIIMLFDEKQVMDLDELVTITKNSEIIFLRLVPLIGG